MILPICQQEDACNRVDYPSALESLKRLEHPTGDGGPAVRLQPHNLLLKHLLIAFGHPEQRRDPPRLMIEYNQGHPIPFLEIPEQPSESLPDLPNLALLFHAATHVNNTDQVDGRPVDLELSLVFGLDVDEDGGGVGGSQGDLGVEGGQREGQAGG